MAEDFELRKINIRAAFLQAKQLDREVFLQPPKDIKRDGYIWKLKKPLYGLNDASQKFWLRAKTSYIIFDGPLNRRSDVPPGGACQLPFPCNAPVVTWHMREMRIFADKQTDNQSKSEFKSWGHLIHCGLWIVGERANRLKFYLNVIFLIWLRNIDTFMWR